MKRTIALFVFSIMLFTSITLDIAAYSGMAKNPAVCEYKVTVKKADPSVVKKDGVIDVDGGEYVKAYVPFSELSVNYRNDSVYPMADAMARTMEYYFSWDTVHGFNFAVKYFAKGKLRDGTEWNGYYTNFPNRFGSLDPSVPQDNFMSNIGLCFASGVHKNTKSWSLLYYAIGKKLDGSDYLYGHWNQLGNSGRYSPKGGRDFEVFYPGDGSVIFEWSIPFSEFIDVAPTDGVSFGFTLSASAGKDTTDTPINNCWSVALGQHAWLVQSKIDNSHATAILSTEPVKRTPVVTEAPPVSDKSNETSPLVTSPPSTTVATETPTETPAEAPTARPTEPPTQPVTTGIVTDIVTSHVYVGTDTNGEDLTQIVTEVVTSVVTESSTLSANGNDAPQTADPVIIAAITAVISVCGAVVTRKRR